IVLGGGNADAAELAFLLEFAERFEGGGVAVPGARPGVELDDVDGFGVQVAQAALEALAQVCFGVAVLAAIVRRGRPLAAGRRGDFGGDVDTIALSLGNDFGDQLFAAAVAVDLRGVDEVAAEIEGAAEGFEG